MRIEVVTLFPEFVGQAVRVGVLGRAIETGRVTVHATTPREFATDGIAVNGLWPRTLIATSALDVIDVGTSHARKPEIMADAAHIILSGDSRRVTGCFFIDEPVLRDAGITDFEAYAVDPTRTPRMDLFVPDDVI